MALALVPGGATERHAVIQGAVVADFCGLPHHHPHAVVDEDAAADGGTRVNFDPGEPAADMRGETCQPFPFHAPQLVRQAVDNHGVKARVGGDDLKPRACGRITVEHDGDVFLELAEQVHAFENALSE